MEYLLKESYSDIGLKEWILHLNKASRLNPKQNKEARLFSLSNISP